MPYGVLYAKVEQLRIASTSGICHDLRFKFEMKHINANIILIEILYTLHTVSHHLFIEQQ